MNVQHNILTFDTSGRHYCAGRIVLRVALIGEYDSELPTSLVHVCLELQDTRPMYIDTWLRRLDVDAVAASGVPVIEYDGNV